MRIFFDTEFLEDGKTIELISIGMVREDGAEYYAVNEDMDLFDVVRDDWLRANVVGFLPLIVTRCEDRYGPSKKYSRTIYRTDKQPSEHWKLRNEIRDDILDFAGSEPEFWAYYADYDWVVLCQLFGRMIDLPKGWPMFCRDLKQYASDKGFYKLPPTQQHEHHALADARWVQQAYEYVRSMSASDRSITS